MWPGVSCRQFPCELELVGWEKESRCRSPEASQGCELHADVGGGNSYPETEMVTGKDWASDGQRFRTSH